jgi:hypothetical protein
MIQHDALLASSYCRSISVYIGLLVGCARREADGNVGTILIQALNR